MFDQVKGKPVPEDPTSSYLVYPLAGAYCVFDGRLGHGVLDSFAKSKRATLLVNWWTHQPQAVGMATDAQLEEFGIPMLVPLDSSSGGGLEHVLGALSLQSSEDDGAAQQQQQQQQQQGSSNSGSTEAADGVAIPEVAGPDAAKLDHAVLVSCFLWRVCQGGL